MAINKVIYGDDTLIDLTQTTAEAGDVAEGKMFMDRGGNLLQGTMVGGTADYEELENKPKINNVELVGNKTTSDLGITIPTKTSQLNNDSGYITSSSVPTKTSQLNNDSGFITKSVNNLDNYTLSSSLKAVATSGSYNDLTDKPTLFSGNYNDLTNKPTIPDELKDLTDDSTHRLVSDTEKSTWNSKSDFSGSYDDLTNKPTIPTIPENVSSFNNDAGYITKEVNDLTNYSLTTTLQANKSIARGIEYIIGTQTGATNLWTGVSTDTGCSNSTLYTGKVIIYHLNQAGSSSSATLNLTLPDGTKTGAKNVYRLATTTTTTNFAAGCDILMVFDGTNWKVNAYVDTSGSNTIGYQLRTNSALWANKTGYTMNRYTLLFEVDGGLSGAATTIATGTSKTTVNFKYIPGGIIKYYSTSGNIANGSNFAVSGLWDQYACNLSYTFNTGSTLVSGKPVYMRCVVNADGTLSPDYSGTPSHPIVQALPTSEDNKAYVYLGQAYSTTNIELMFSHPIYEYKNNKIKIYTG